jgi:hypothetical protein
MPGDMYGRLLEYEGWKNNHFSISVIEGYPLSVIVNFYMDTVPFNLGKLSVI